MVSEKRSLDSWCSSSVSSFLCKQQWLHLCLQSNTTNLSNYFGFKMISSRRFLLHHFGFCSSGKSDWFIIWTSMTVIDQPRYHSWLFGFSSSGYSFEWRFFSIVVFLSKYVVTQHSWLLVSMECYISFGCPTMISNLTGKNDTLYLSPTSIKI